MVKKDTNIFDNIVAEDYLGDAGQALDKTPRPDRPIRMVALDSIIRMAAGQTRDQVFNYNDDSQDQELADSIKEHGVIQAIGVRPTTRGLGVEKQYELVWGERRLAAAKHWGIGYIPAQIVTDEDDTRLLTVVENTGRKDLTEFERANALVMLQEENPDWKISDIVRKTGIKQGSAYNLVRAITDSPAPLKTLFRNGVSPRAIIELQPIFAELSEAKALSFAKQLEGISASDAAALNRHLKAGSSLEQALAFVRAMQTPASAPPASAAKQTPARAGKRPGGASAASIVDASTYKLFSGITGVPEETVERLAKQLGKRGGTGEILLAACLYLAKSGNEEEAAGLAQRAFALKKVRAVLSKYLDNVQRASSLMASIEDPQIKDFISGLYGIRDRDE